MHWGIFLLSVENVQAKVGLDIRKGELKLKASLFANTKLYGSENYKFLKTVAVNFRETCLFLLLLVRNWKKLSVKECGRC